MKPVQVIVAAGAVLAFLLFVPAPAGCGCAERKDKLRGFLA